MNNSDSKKPKPNFRLFVHPIEKIEKEYGRKRKKYIGVDSRDKDINELSERTGLSKEKVLSTLDAIEEEKQKMEEAVKAAKAGNPGTKQIN